MLLLSSLLPPVVELKKNKFEVLIQFKRFKLIHFSYHESFDLDHNFEVGLQTISWIERSEMKHNIVNIVIFYN